MQLPFDLAGVRQEKEGRLAMKIQGKSLVCSGCRRIYFLRNRSHTRKEECFVGIIKVCSEPVVIGKNICFWTLNKEKRIFNVLRGRKRMDRIWILPGEKLLVFGNLQMTQDVQVSYCKKCGKKLVAIKQIQYLLADRTTIKL